jgi:hypothetical protein
LYPAACEEHLAKKAEKAKKAKKNESTVSSFHSSLSRSPHLFILDSGSSAHMISDSNFFHTLELKELGSVQTSLGQDDLKIRGIGSV